MEKSLDNIFCKHTIQKNSEDLMGALNSITSPLGTPVATAVSPSRLSLSLLLLSLQSVTIYLYKFVQKAQNTWQSHTANRTVRPQRY